LFGFFRDQKGTKNALETGRTFATLLADMDLRQRLLEARTEDEFKRILLKHTQELAEEQAISIRVDHGSATRLSTGGESNVRLDALFFSFFLITVLLARNNICALIGRRAKSCADLGRASERICHDVCPTTSLITRMV
jgi:hypothetical protein